MKILTVVGARPQFIKASALSRVIAEKQGVEEILVHTGQHYDANMSDIFFSELDMAAPTIHMGIGSGQHGAQTAKMLHGIEDILLEQKPDWMLVYGDTNSTLAGALAAVKQHIPIAHVEAGLRSFNRKMPEEINRVLTDHASDLLFAPTERAVENLRNEGLAENKIIRTGDIMYDVSLYFGAKSDAHSAVLHENGLKKGEYILATVHRAENTDNIDRLKAIFEGFEAVHGDIPVVLPLHPRTKAILEKNGLSERFELKIIDPVGYLDMVALEKNAALIATDSGGVQKEAYFYGVPCVTLRDETEWVELVEAGWNRLCPPVSAQNVTSTLREALNAQKPPYNALYGDGNTADIILKALG